MPRINFKVVELLVVVTIIGFLSALLLPATKQAREAARSVAASAMQESRLKAGEDKVKARFVNLQTAQVVPRKIIYEANVVLVVTDMADTESQIAKLLKQVNGYVAESSVDRQQGEQLTGRWRVRVPVGQFDSFLDAVSKLGVAENRDQTAQDVTEEFVDLEAQIANKKKLEERIVALLKDSSGKIKDVIEVERELARVRGEIEQMQGRLRYLTNRTDYTTVSISARVEENYVPPTAASFASRIAQAWGMSVEALRNFGEQLTIAVVYAFPWLVIFGVVAVPMYVLVRKRVVAVHKPVSVGPPQL
jgi:uncharacterized coiled-coil protein SlyX